MQIPISHLMAQLWADVYLCKIVRLSYQVNNRRQHAAYEDADKECKKDSGEGLQFFFGVKTSSMKTKKAMPNPLMTTAQKLMGYWGHLFRVVRSYFAGEVMLINTTARITIIKIPLKSIIT